MSTLRLKQLKMTQDIYSYKTKVIALVLMNIAPSSDIKGRELSSSPLISQLGTIFANISAITLYYFIVSGEIRVYLVKIKVVSITS